MVTARVAVGTTPTLTQTDQLVSLAHPGNSTTKHHLAVRHVHTLVMRVN